MFYVNKAGPKDETIKFWQRSGSFSRYKKKSIMFRGPTSGRGLHCTRPVWLGDTESLLVHTVYSICEKKLMTGTVRYYNKLSMKPFFIKTHDGSWKAFPMAYKKFKSQW